MSNGIDPSIFDEPLHIIPLGYFTQVAGEWEVTVGDRPSGMKKFGLRLHREDFELLASLDPGVQNRVFSTRERALLARLAEVGLVRFHRPDSGVEDLDLIPVPRKDFILEEILDEGYRIGIGSNESLTVSEYASRFITKINGTRSVREIVGAIEKEALADPEDAEAIAEYEKESGEPFPKYLYTVAIETVGDLHRSGAATFEPGA